MMRFSKRFLCLAAGVVISAIFSSPSFAQNCDAPNPSVAISPPAASVSSNAAAFFGVWGGTWTFQGIRKTRADMCARLQRIGDQQQLCQCELLLWDSIGYRCRATV